MRIDQLREDLAFCDAQITEAHAEIERANRRIKHYEREVQRINDLIERDYK